MILLVMRWTLAVYKTSDISRAIIETLDSLSPIKVSIIVRQISEVSGPIHTNLDKFENEVFAPQTDKKFPVHTIVPTNPEHAQTTVDGDL